MKILFFIFLFMGSCTSIFYTKDFWWSVEIKDGNVLSTAITPFVGTPVPTSPYPTFTLVPTSSQVAPSPTRDIFPSSTPFVFRTSTPIPSPTISMCAGVVTDSLTKRSSPSISSSVKGGLVRGMVVTFTEYSSDRKWLHLVDGTWAKIQNDASPFNLYLAVGSC